MLDDEVVLVQQFSEINNLPHLRCDCPNIKFTKETHLKICENCWCYICDVNVSGCSDWKNHCHANPNDKARIFQWKKMRSEHRSLKKNCIVLTDVKQPTPKPSKYSPIKTKFTNHISNYFSSSKTNPSKCVLVDLTENSDSTLINSNTSLANKPNKIANDNISTDVNFIKKSNSPAVIKSIDSVKIGSNIVENKMFKNDEISDKNVAQMNICETDDLYSKLFGDERCTICNKPTATFDGKCLQCRWDMSEQGQRVTKELA